jgi:hypothetical protein
MVIKSRGRAVSASVEHHLLWDEPLEPAHPKSGMLSLGYHDPIHRMKFDKLIPTRMFRWLVTRHLVLAAELSTTQPPLVVVLQIYAQGMYTTTSSRPRASSRK